MSRTYQVTLENRGGKEVERELPSNPYDAREMACSLAKKNDAWLGSVWSSRNGDHFAVSSSGDMEEMTSDMDDEHDEWQCGDDEFDEYGVPRW